MTLLEARKIVSYIIDWQLVIRGNYRHEFSRKIDLSKYTLADLIKANEMVTANFKRKESLARYHISKGHKTQPVCMPMTLDERLIAAAYVAMNWEADADNIVAIVDDKAVIVVKAKYS